MDFDRMRKLLSKFKKSDSDLPVRERTCLRAPHRQAQTRQIDSNLCKRLNEFSGRFYNLMKPVLECIMAFACLMIGSPVLIITAIIIRITSDGPVFYTQLRVGRNGRLFRIIKFRTMCADAESQTGPVWSRYNDTRVTAIGRFLRKTHIDELSQFINVLKGDMGIIGPRPERPHFVDMLKGEIEGYAKRLSVKPGITGLAQCYYKYDESFRDVRRKLRYDIFYIKKMCLKLDIKILWRTFNTVSYRGLK